MTEEWVAIYKFARLAGLAPGTYLLEVSGPHASAARVVIEVDLSEA